MKKALLFIGLVVLGLSAMGQNCTVDATSATDPGIYPPAPGFIDSDGVIFMPNAEVGEPYDVTAQVKVPKDTIVDTLGFQLTVTIDSMKIHSLDNLPAGITYACDNNDCFWLGDANGCVRLTGIPAASTAGMTYTVAVKTVGYGTMPILGSVIDTFFFDMRITVDGTVSAEELSKQPLQVFPNPANAYLEVQLPSQLAKTTATLTLVTASGAMVIQEQATISSVPTRLSTAHLPAGFYVLQVEVGTHHFREKVWIQH
ncbi:MAG: T9SS type A sorting domain-containing protein [Schleiferiaceae bacterium]|nr:T9SS type A sorting domain-containing protein [Schleiferiaceae bacterium]